MSISCDIFTPTACELLREGSNHSIFVNRATRKASTVPRHREVDSYLARKICRELEIPPPAGILTSR